MRHIALRNKSPDLLPVIRSGTKTYHMIQFEDAYDFESYMRAQMGRMHFFYVNNGKWRDDMSGRIIPVTVTCICFHSTPEKPAEIRLECEGNIVDDWLRAQGDQDVDKVKPILWLDYDEMYRTFAFYRETRKG